MAELNTARWTQVDRSLYADHVKKLNAPRLGHESRHASVTPAETLCQYRTLIQRVARIAAGDGELTEQERSDLYVFTELQLDYFTGLHHPKHLDTADLLHDGPVLAIKIKNLKKMSGRERPPERDYIYRTLAQCLLTYTYQAFAGYYSRMYVLVESERHGRVIVKLLESDLEPLLEPLISEGIRPEDLPYINWGLGRTWEEAKLVSRGALLQDRVPLDNFEPGAHSKG